MKIRHFLAGVLVFSLLAFNSFAGEFKSGVLQNSSGVEIAMAEPSVTIILPKDGDTVDSTVEVKWNLKKAKKAAHVHFYLDGKNLGPKEGNDYTLKNLTPGKHTIELQPATASHDEIGTAGSITIIVK